MSMQPLVGSGCSLISWQIRIFLVFLSQTTEEGFPKKMTFDYTFAIKWRSFSLGILCV